MSTPPTEDPRLQRRFSLLPATALNMTNMMGAGPFITIPLLMSAMGGPQAMLGWVVALAIVICDGMVWSELGAAMPGSGGSFHYLREAFRRTRLGRLMPFLFVWQFVLSGPLEIASGYIGFASYASYIWKGLTRGGIIALVVAVGVLNIVLLYRRIGSIARITVSLWVGTLITVLAVIVAGAMHFQPRLAFDFPPGAFNFSLGFFLGLGAASRIGIYDYLGYYDVCYIGDEVRDPGRVIPRSILISTVAVALIYVGINMSIIGVVPWREFVPAEAHPASGFIVSVFMERLYGPAVATVCTLLVLWTAFGSVFALLLGYSRIPFAAAESGYFFRPFARLHPTGGFPYVSLIVVGAISIVAGFFSLGTVIDALIVTRILVQFMGQIVGLMMLRRQAPGMPRPYRMWLYPLPALVALLGWIFVFATTQLRVIGFGIGVLAAGCVAFALWSRRSERVRSAGTAGAALVLLALGGIAGSVSAQSAPPPRDTGRRDSVQADTTRRDSVRTVQDAHAMGAALYSLVFAPAAIAGLAETTPGLGTQSSRVGFRRSHVALYATAGLASGRRGPVLGASWTGAGRAEIMLRRTFVALDVEQFQLERHVEYRALRAGWIGGSFGNIGGGVTLGYRSVPGLRRQEGVEVGFPFVAGSAGSWTRLESSYVISNRQSSWNYRAQWEHRLGGGPLLVGLVGELDSWELRNHGALSHGSFGVLLGAIASR